MKVVIINGHAESGKSTFVNFCKQYEKVEVQELSMVDAAKAMAEIIGWNESQKTERDRKFLSDLKDLIDNYNDGSYEYIKYIMENFIYQHDYQKELIIFIHAREPKDIERLKKEYNARSVVVRRKFVEGIQLNNHADSDWWMPHYDYTIMNNDSLEYLEKNSKKFIDHILADKEWEGIEL